MARTRQIKPGFFLNDELWKCSPHSRLLFIGLWTLADREGRLKKRPTLFRGALFPYEHDLATASMLEELESHGFITSYESGEEQLLLINGFKKHQTPHPKEQKSELPPVHGKGEPRCVEANPLPSNPLPSNPCVGGDPLPEEDSPPMTADEKTVFDAWYKRKGMEIPEHKFLVMKAAVREWKLPWMLIMITKSQGSSFHACLVEAEFQERKGNCLLPKESLPADEDAKNPPCSVLKCDANGYYHVQERWFCRYHHKNYESACDEVRKKARAFKPAQLQASVERQREAVTAPERGDRDENVPEHPF